MKIMPINNIAAKLILKGVENIQMLEPHLPNATKNQDIAAKSIIINKTLAIC